MVLHAAWRLPGRAEESQTGLQGSRAFG
jgi:hypothetical protein